MSIPRNEYPRPQFVRENWTNLNGEWEFSFEEPTFDKTILVPYVFESKLSGIEDPSFHEVVWYRRTIALDKPLDKQRMLLHFGAVDYECSVYINDKKVMDHIGGHIGFSADITDYVELGDNTVVVRVFDPSTDLQIPRGKQYWKEESASIFYTRTTGIWQTVWAEIVPETYLSKIWLTADIDTRTLNIRYEIEGDADSLEIQMLFDRDTTGHITVHNPPHAGECSVEINLDTIRDAETFDHYLWTPERPNLFDLRLTLTKGEQIDFVKSYVGMRKVSVDKGRFLLNNHPYYQRLLLDQGYWEESIMTAPTDEAFIKDIEMSKEMGFNGVRKHQKIEDPRFMYHADRLGFLVWGEIAAAYEYSRPYVKRITHEWIDAIFRDYNHPCIVAWTPLNESWGVPNIADRAEQQHHSAAMYHLTKSLDSTRLVISNDGWEHTVTDLLTIHDYSPDKNILMNRYKDLESTLAARPASRPLYAHGWEYQGEPILMTEFGGISYRKGEWDGWGYSQADSDEDYIQRYYAVVSAMYESPLIHGFCYTQLSDVEQEINGVLTYDRQYKVDPEIIRAINENRYQPE